MSFRNWCFGSVTLLILLGFAGAIRASSAGTESAAASKNIEGTWLIQITAVSCQTGAPLGTFSSLYSFAEGGTVTNTTSGATPAARSPGLGAWEKTGGHTFKAMSLSFLFSPAGAWTGTQRIVNAFEIFDDRDELTGTITVEVFNTGGTLVSTMCAIPVGHRLEP